MWQIQVLYCSVVNSCLCDFFLHSIDTVTEVLGENIEKKQKIQPELVSFQDEFLINKVKQKFNIIFTHVSDSHSRIAPNQILKQVREKFDVWNS